VAQQNCGSSVKIAVIQEVGMEGFCLHRLLENAGIESWLVDPGSIATSRRSRRVKTDRIDGEALIRVLMAFKRGEPRVGSMVVPPSPAEEDRRRIGRERRDLLGKRVEETNKIRGLLFTHGVREFDPLANNSRQNLDKLRTGDGRALPPHLKAELLRALHRLNLLIDQIKAVEAERDALADEAAALAPVNVLAKLKASANPSRGRFPVIREKTGNFAKSLA
jgi:transposase